MHALLHAATHRERLAELQIRQAQKGRAFIHFHHTAGNIASAYALMHRDDLAIQWLQTAARQGFPCYPVFARDPNLTNLKNDLRFAQFIADQKKQWEYYKTALGPGVVLEDHPHTSFLCNAPGNKTFWYY
jgi:hypothetical protein